VRNKKPLFIGYNSVWNPRYFSFISRGWPRK